MLKETVGILRPLPPLSGRQMSCRHPGRAPDRTLPSALITRKELGSPLDRDSDMPAVSAALPGAGRAAAAALPPRSLRAHQPMPRVREGRRAPRSLAPAAGGGSHGAHAGARPTLPQNLARLPGLSATSLPGLSAA